MAVSTKITRDMLRAFYLKYLGREPTEEDYNIHLYGGFRNDPAGLEQSIAQSAEAAAFAQRGAGGTTEEDPFLAFLNSLGDGGGGGADPEYTDLLKQNIREQIRVQQEENARVEKRRQLLSDALQKTYGIDLETFESQQALQAAKTSKLQGERLEAGLEGKLPVDPALERQISTDEKTLREKLRQQLGPGFETSTPGSQSLADFKQRATELRTAAQKGAIAEGTSPQIASTQYGLSLIGAEGAPDSNAILGGLQASNQQQALAQNTAQMRLQGLLAIRQMAQQERLANLDAQTRLGIANQAYPNNTGGGAGQLIGTVVGAAAPFIYDYFRGSSGTPSGSSIARSYSQARNDRLYT